MGFMDKMKQQATGLAAKAQEGVKSGQAKVGGAEANKKSEALLRDLGAAVYAQRKGTAGQENDAEIERIVGELRVLETEQAAPVDTAPTAAAVPSPGEGAAAPAPQGNYSLDDL